MYVINLNSFYGACCLTAEMNAGVTPPSIQLRKRSNVSVTGIRKLHVLLAQFAPKGEGETDNTIPNISVYENILFYACCNNGSRAKSYKFCAGLPVS